MSVTLSKSEVNHLRKLLGWVACEIGQAPEDMIGTLKSIADKLDAVPDDAGKQRLAESYAKAQNIPVYVRSAVKQLQSAIRERCGDVVDAEVCQAGIAPQSALIPGMKAEVSRAN